MLTSQIHTIMEYFPKIIISKNYQNINVDLPKVGTMSISSVYLSNIMENKEEKWEKEGK